MRMKWGLIYCLWDISWGIHGVLWFNGFPRYRTVDPGVVSTLAAQVRTLASLAWAKCPCICFRRSSTYRCSKPRWLAKAGKVYVTWWIHCQWCWLMVDYWWLIDSWFCWVTWFIVIIGTIPRGVITCGLGNSTELNGRVSSHVWLPEGTWLSFGFGVES